MHRRRLVILAVVLLGAGGREVASQAPAAPRADRPYASATTAILVDVVVRDRKGSPVTDLSASNFEVAEDGVVQTIDTFTRVSRGGGIGVGIAWRTPGTTATVTAAPDPARPAAAPDAAGHEAATAVVFDQLSAESLRLAQKALLGYVPMNGDSAVRVGVFATDPGVRVLQPYTTDRALVRRAVTRLVPSGTSAQEQKGDRTEELLARRRELEQQTQALTAVASTTTGAALSRSSSDLGIRETELRLVQTELNMLRSFDNLDRDHRGYDTSLALSMVVDSLAALPGRKTIVFFSEGLPVSPVLSARLDLVIEAANRAHVTTYAIDANGLRTKSGSATIMKEMQAFVDERTSQLASTSDRTNQPLAMGFERVEDTFKLDSRTGLARLAEDTGGFLVEGSNDLSSAFRRIDEDNQFHYLLTYSPRNAEFDGKFRTIRVKVDRPGVHVFSRKGYRAVRAAPPLSAASYETPALALLDRTPLPNAFPVHAAAFSFPDPERPGLTPVLVRVDTSVLRFDVDARRGTYSAQTAIVVRIRDRDGREVEKLSQQYLLTGEARDVEAAKKGEILFYREVDLPPGVYTMESIVLDAGAQQGSARVATLTVPRVEPAALGVSSLVIVKRVEDVGETPATAGRPAPAAKVAAPLYVGRTLLYPNLGEPIVKSGGEMPFYFTIYGRSDAVAATARLLRNGQPLAEAPLALPAATGVRRPHVGRLSIGSLPAGTYELRILVTAPGLEASRAAFFTLRD